MPPRIPNTLPTFPSTTCPYQSCLVKHTERCFSSTPRIDASAGKYKAPTRLRRQMNIWLATKGKVFRDPPNAPNYLGAYDINGRRIIRGKEENSDNKNNDRKDNNRTNYLTESDLTPFPKNRSFRSQAVTSDDLREAVWSKVMKDGLSVSHVSAELGVEMNRVGAIVRLKEIEKEWVEKRKPLAKAYQKAVLAMLPVTSYPLVPGAPVHESINDLPVHTATTAQLWHPTSESREFTRADAATVFLEGLKPADDRVPHPELHVMEKDRVAGMPLDERLTLARQRAEQLEEKKAQAEARKQAWEAKNVTVIPKTRWDFKFTNFSVEEAGKNGRGHRGVGARYGVPHEDRKRGQIKLPTRVE